MSGSIYNFQATSLQGKEIGLDTFKGKTILIVNTASKCGLTPQYEGLEKLYQKYKHQDFVILGFPCNQFANQEPGDEKSIAEGCLLNYGVTFPVFAKVDVNGKNAHPIFKYLKSQLGGFPGRKIKWNFTKFLIDHRGNPVKRYSPYAKPEAIEPDLEKLLNTGHAADNTEDIIRNKTSFLQNMARILLGVFLIVAGVSHLSWSRTEFLAQVPGWVPMAGDTVVLLSGAVEIILGALLVFFKSGRIQTGLATALFFVLIFPGNISQYVNGVDGFGLDTDQARLIRLFFQPVLVIWALWSTGAFNMWRKK